MAVNEMESVETMPISEIQSFGSIRFSSAILWPLLSRPNRLTVCFTRWCVSTGSTTRAGVDNAWEQKKLEARKLLENADESHLPKRSEGVHALLGNLTERKTRLP